MARELSGGGDDGENPNTERLRKKGKDGRTALFLARRRKGKRTAKTARSQNKSLFLLLLFFLSGDLDGFKLLPVISENVIFGKENCHHIPLCPEM